MPFGRHKGQLLQYIPEDYLMWLLDGCDNLRPRLRQAVERELERREAEARAQGPPGRGWQPPAVNARAVAAAWFKSMSLQYHPDKSGSDAEMWVVVHGFELLKKLVGLS
jgi:hypothetical protein